uniref:ORF7 n=1 Tax=Amycolatopsis benzoatilytica TaxID=346045 RepID=A3FG40_9PSEU|nr:unknown [Cloning vector pDXM32]ABN48416.1 ORF7 [Amycolatopsis benzoatilytica]
MLAAAAELRRQEPILAQLTARAVRALCRPYWAAGWANDDVRHALRWRPRATSSLPAMEQAKIHAPYRWAQSRLAAWRTDTGKVLPGHSHMERAQRTREHAVVARFGKAALAAMPAGSGPLRPVDVRRFGRRRVDAAVETLRRRRAAELADERAAVRSQAEAADPEHARRVADEFRAERERRQAAGRERLLEQARAAAAERAEQDQPAPASTWTPQGPAQTPEERQEAALARARAEGRVPLVRRRRRTRW